MSLVTTLTTLILKTALKKKKFTSNHADYADLRDYIEINFTTDYTDYVDFRDYIKNNYTTDYADFRYYHH